MDLFSSLPSIIFLKIINYLPLKDRFLIGSVNRNFHYFSTLAVSKTKWLEFNSENENYVNLSPASFLESINSRLENLEWVKLFPNDIESEKILELIEIFSQFTLPRLTELDLGYYVNLDGAFMTMDKLKKRHEIFANILRRIPNLRILRIHHQPAPFPSDFVCENLQELELKFCDDQIASSLIGWCPNLKKFKLHGPTPRRYIATFFLEKFFASSPKIRHLDLGEFFVEFRDSFWRLPLISLGFSKNRKEINDYVMEKIAHSFPDLENLRVGSVELSQRGLTALKSLKNLRALFIRWANGGNYGHDLHFDEELRFLALGCPKLEHVQIDANISATTLRIIVRHCPNIQILDIRQIVGVETFNDAGLVAESLARMENRKLLIRLGEKKWRQICQLSELNEVFEFVRFTGWSIDPI